MIQTQTQTRRSTQAEYMMMTRTIYSATMSRITDPLPSLLQWYLASYLPAETMLHERGLLPVLYEGLFLALAHQLAAQGLQSTERGEFLHSPSMMSLLEASQQGALFFLPSLHIYPILYLATDLGISKIS
jgi:hypothetical protein